MTAILTEQALKKAICDLTVVDQIVDGFEVTLPQVYGNGEVVVIVVEPIEGGWLVHDQGMAAFMLERAGSTLKGKLTAQVQHGVAQYGCEFVKARVAKTTADVTEIAAVAAIVGCASRYVADLAYQMEPAPMFDFRRQMVENLMAAVGRNRIKENAEVTAITGTRFQVTAAILADDGSGPIAYVEAVSNHEAVARKFRSFYEIMKTPSIARVQRFAIYNEHGNMSGGDMELLKDVCTPLSLNDSKNELQAWQSTRH